MISNSLWLTHEQRAGSLIINHDNRVPAPSKAMGFTCTRIGLFGWFNLWDHLALWKTDSSYDNLTKGKI